MSACICCIPSCMHNILSSRHNILTCMHKMPTWRMHTQNANMHTQYTNLQYVCTTCCYASMHNMHACITSNSHSPKIRWAHKGISHAFEKDFEVTEKLYHLQTNVRDRWENHSQPAKGPGVCCIRYQGCIHRFGSSKGCVQKQIGKSNAYSRSLNFSQAWSHCIVGFISLDPTMQGPLYLQWFWGKTYKRTGTIVSTNNSIKPVSRIKWYSSWKPQVLWPAYVARGVGRMGLERLSGLLKTV